MGRTVHSRVVSELLYQPALQMSLFGGRETDIIFENASV